MDYISQNVDVFQRWVVLCGIGVCIAIVGDVIAHIAVKLIKEIINGRR